MCAYFSWLTGLPSIVKLHSQREPIFGQGPCLGRSCRERESNWLMRTIRLRPSNQLTARLDEHNRMKLGQACPLRSNTISCIMTSTTRGYHCIVRRRSTVELSSTPSSSALWRFLDRPAEWRSWRRCEESATSSRPKGSKRRK